MVSNTTVSHFLPSAKHFYTSAASYFISNRIARAYFFVTVSPFPPVLYSRSS